MFIQYIHIVNIKCACAIEYVITYYYNVDLCEGNIELIINFTTPSIQNDIVINLCLFSE